MTDEEVRTLQNRVVEAIQAEEYQLAYDLIETALESAGSDRYKELLEEQKKLNEELEQKLQDLQTPPLSRGLVLGPSPDDEKNVVIGAGGQRLEVRIAAEVGMEPGDLTPGWEAWLNEDKHIIKVRSPGSSGEAAAVTAILDDGRLEVKGHGHEEIIVDRVMSLDAGALEVGDRVRVDPHLAVALEKLPQPENKELELKKVPDVTYDQIGGLDGQIEEVREAIELPYLYHHLFARYHLTRPKGILLYGPPGCGKTMIAKAIANNLTAEIGRNVREIAETLELLVAVRSDEEPGDGEGEDAAVTTGEDAAATRDSELATAHAAWKRKVRRGPAEDAEAAPTAAGAAPDRAAIEAELLAFLATRGIDVSDPEAALGQIKARLDENSQAFFISIKGPELLDKYVGETEHSIRQLFQQAKRKASAATPVIMFFDEIEALFRRRGSRVSSDIESTIVPQFLSEMDGVDEMADVIIIGATNRQDLLDPAILRPGRLDAKIKVDRPDRAAARSIFGKKLEADLPLDEREVTAAGSPAAAIARLIDRAVAALYSESTRYQVAGKQVEGGSKTFLCRQFASGAMIESIVSRAKRRAVKREIDQGRQGIDCAGLLESVREELEQNKDQLVATELQMSEEDLTIELAMADGGAAAATANPWLRPIRRPWAERGSGEAASAGAGDAAVS